MINNLMKALVICCLFFYCFSFAIANDGPSITGSSDAWAGSGHRVAFVKEVYDGDTITVDINLGYGIVLINQRLRLYGINTPEVRGPEKPQGLVTRDAVRDLILHKIVILDPHSFKKGKYGRWLATVWYKPDPNGLTWINLNQYIVQAGLGAAASY